MGLKIVPRDGATITLGENNANPTTFIDKDGSLIGCLGKAIFECSPTTGMIRDVVTLAEESYYYDYPEQTTKWAITGTTYLRDGTVEVKTFRWTRADRDYSNTPILEVISDRVAMASGGGGLGHFQYVSYTVYPGGTPGTDPSDWVIIQWHATPDLADGELDYFTTLFKPQIEDDMIEAISCGQQYFPGR